MTKLTIKRSDERMNRFRKIKIVLDGQMIGTIENGETKDFDINEGFHRLEAKIDWCSSNTISFTIPAGGNKRFYLSSFAEHDSVKTRTGLFYITIGRKSYLRLEEQIQRAD